MCTIRMDVQTCKIEIKIADKFTLIVKPLRHQLEGDVIMRK